MVFTIAKRQAVITKAKVNGTLNLGITEYKIVIGNPTRKADRR